MMVVAMTPMNFLTRNLTITEIPRRNSGSKWHRQNESNTPNDDAENFGSNHLLIN